jgi:hypothetical protein
MTMTATAGVPHTQAGLAAGLINTTRQIGGAVGLAVMATFAASAATHDLHRGVKLVAALTAGYDRAFAIGAGALLVGAVLALALPALRPAVMTAVSQARPRAQGPGSSGPDAAAGSGGVFVTAAD